eukprot:TRINITY_DN5982_c0_g3_i1.p2 TRINITY_DN5982_c0_g3~~TRINITY_DN5982_c0_g3_i1.p2  ORF type:complete len:243 (-),score=8.93 TRINITY_DN5982_c0_g3_i1:503-1231(-)
MFYRGLSHSIARLWSAYNAQLHTYPLQTQIISSGVLWWLGDYFAQRIENLEDNKEINYKRWFTTTVYGAIFIGPFGHYWYMGLDQAVRRFFTPKTISFVTSKIVADLAIFDALHITLFFTLLTRTEGGDWQAVIDKLKADFFPTFGVEISLWTPVHSVNFSVIPVKHQLMFVNLCSLVDNTFVCWARSQQNWAESITKWIRPALAEAALAEEAKQQHISSCKEENKQQQDKYIVAQRSKDPC